MMRTPDTESMKTNWKTEEGAKRLNTQAYQGQVKLIKAFTKASQNTKTHKGETFKIKQGTANIKP